MPRQQQPSTGNMRDMLSRLNSQGDFLERVIVAQYQRVLQGAAQKLSSQSTPSALQPGARQPDANASLFPALKDAIAGLFRSQPQQSTPSPTRMQQMASFAGDMGLGRMQQQLSRRADTDAAKAGNPMAGLKVAQERFAKISEGFKTVRAGVNAIAPTATAGAEVSGVGGAFKALGGAGEMLGGMGGAAEALGAVLGPVGAFGAALVGGVEKLQEWGKSLHDANMQFAQFSGSMAQVQANQDLRDQMLNMRKGEARAASAEHLSQGMNSLNQALAPIENGIANLGNKIVGNLALWAGEIIKKIEKLIPWLEDNEEEGLNPLSEWDEIANEKWHQTYMRPARFNNK